MADILRLLGDTMERGEERKRRNNRELLAAINTRPGMVVLGTVLLVIALVLISPQIEEWETANDPNVIIFDVSGFDFGNEEINRSYQEMLESQYEQQLAQEKFARGAAIVFALGGAACYVRAALPWKKKEEAGTICAEAPSKEAEAAETFQQPVESPAPQSAETDSKTDRLENLKNLYEAGILSREEYDARRKKL